MFASFCFVAPAANCGGFHCFSGIHRETRCNNICPGKKATNRALHSFRMRAAAAFIKSFEGPQNAQAPNLVASWASAAIHMFGGSRMCLFFAERLKSRDPECRTSGAL